MKLIAALIIGMLTAAQALAVEHVATIEAKFRGTSSVNKYVYTISQSAHSQWKIEVFTGCPSFPCYDKDFVTNYFVIPELLTPPMMADGSPRVQLGSNMTLQYFNEWGDGSYYELQLLDADGSIQEKIKLFFYPSFNNKPYEP